MSVTPWIAGGGDAAAAGGGGAVLLTRKVTYVKPLHLPIPLAPKQCNVWEEHKLLSKSDGGWVVECKSTNDAPKGDCFYVLVQLCGIHLARGQSQLRITMQVNFGGDRTQILFACCLRFVALYARLLSSTPAAHPKFSTSTAHILFVADGVFQTGLGQEHDTVWRRE